MSVSATTGGEPEATGAAKLFEMVTSLVTEFLSTRPEMIGPLFSPSHDKGRSAMIYFDPVMRNKTENYRDRVALQIIAKWRLPHEGKNSRNDKTIFEVHYGNPTHGTHCTVDDPAEAFRQFFHYSSFLANADEVTATVFLNSPIGPAAVLKGHAYRHGGSALTEDINITPLFMARAFTNAQNS